MITVSRCRPAHVDRINPDQSMLEEGECIEEQREGRCCPSGRGRPIDRAGNRQDQVIVIDMAGPILMPIPVARVDRMG